MAPKDIIDTVHNEDEFRAMVEDENGAAYKKLMIVDVYTNWCGPCAQMVPTFKNLQVNVDNFEDRCQVLQVDREMIEEFKEKYTATSKPRFLFYLQGQMVAEIDGLNAPAILRTIDEFIPSIETGED